ncbi:SDR family NAD(P)-dependent oxidoreductase [Leptotrichia sp. oral taxon 847]|uniref:SDR family NAD(P)-dependent oxidoreductase n=1 Tax=Leptotrichia sp. oral taxon 847 TaxID=1785996 RepID=UPI000767E0E8|nr:SDR family oxidoreductase [Leptotrichia sp. oral taxon 847]AMD95239.1 short-chain dehydrogenase [Leptotrichia sp. oral taxon 847]
METVLITGASSGIGYELAKIYAKNNYNLVLVARRIEKLKQLKREIKKSNSKIQIKIIEMDLSESKAPKKLFFLLENDNIEIDILINNAGIGVYGNFLELSHKEMEKIEKMLNLNIIAVVKLTKIFLNKMKKQKRGTILNVASTAAFQPAGPLMATYYASKSFMLSFSEGIRYELKNTNIKISTLCPGPTITEFEKMSKTKKFTDKIKMMSAEKVAKIAFNGLKKGKKIIIPGYLNKVSVLTSKVFPRELLLKIIKKIQQNK